QSTAINAYLRRASMRVCESGWEGSAHGSNRVPCRPLWLRSCNPLALLATPCSLGVPWAALDGLHAQMMARLAKLARQVGKANVEVMTQREPDLHEWLQEKLVRAARGDLTGEELADLRRFGVDVGEPRADHERQRAS